MKMKNKTGPVVLVCRELGFAIPFGIGYLAGYLKDRGEDVRILFLPQPGEEADFVKTIHQLKPAIVGFGGLYGDLRPINRLTPMLNRAGRDYPIVIGGQMVSPTPQFALEITGADIGVVGEGEIIFHELITALREGGDLSAVGGLIIRSGDDFHETGPGEYIKDLSLLPRVPYELFPQNKWLNIGRNYAANPQPHWRFNDKVISIHGGRGCPYNCNFCYHHSRPRYRAMSDMMAEAEEMLSRFRANMFYFGDDLVIASPKRATELVDGVRRMKRPVEYSISCRFDILDRIDDGLLGELKSSGCRVMGLGVESGSQRILDVMNKKITVDQIVRGFSRLKKVGIIPTVSIMVGQVSETMADAEMSLRLMIDTVRENRLITWSFTIATPFPGSEMYRLCFERGIYKTHHDFYEAYRSFKTVTANLSDMTDEQVIAMRDRLQQTYEREKSTARGFWANRVEGWQKKFTKTARAYHNRLRQELPANRTGAGLVRFYDSCCDGVQTGLDNIRISLLKP